jgi:hypothetical protein
MAKIGRDGHKPKGFLYKASPAHPGMSFRQSVDGLGFVRFSGISKTALAHVEDGTQVHAPNPDLRKKHGQVQTHIGHALRPARDGMAQRGDAAAILDDAGRRDKKC